MNCDLLRPTPPTLPPQNFPEGHPELFSAYGLVMFWQIEWEHLAMCPLGHTCEGIWASHRTTDGDR